MKNTNMQATVFSSQQTTILYRRGFSQITHMTLCTETTLHHIESINSTPTSTTSMNLISTFPTQQAHKIASFPLTCFYLAYRDTLLLPILATAWRKRTETLLWSLHWGYHLSLDSNTFLYFPNPIRKHAFLSLSSVSCWTFSLY